MNSEVHVLEHDFGQKLFHVCDLPRALWLPWQIYTLTPQNPSALAACSSVCPKLLAFLCFKIFTDYSYSQRLGYLFCAKKKLGYLFFVQKIALHALIQVCFGVKITEASQNYIAIHMPEPLWTLAHFLYSSIQKASACSGSYSDLLSEFICCASNSSPRAANKDRPVEV